MNFYNYSYNVGKNNGYSTGGFLVPFALGFATAPLFIRPRVQYYPYQAYGPYSYYRPY